MQTADAIIAQHIGALMIENARQAARIGALVKEVAELRSALANGSVKTGSQSDGLDADRGSPLAATVTTLGAA